MTTSPLPVRPPPEEPGRPRGPIPMTAKKEHLAVDALVAELGVQFPDVPPEEILSVVAAAHHRFDGRPIRDFVPILVGRAARDRLREQPQAA